MTYADRDPHADAGVYDPGYDDAYYDYVEDDEDRGSRGPVFIVLTILVFAALVAVVWVAYQQGVRQADRGEPPLITAEAGPIKIAPEERGGVVVPDQDKMIYENSGANEQTVERLSPPPEQPREVPQPAARITLPGAPASEPVEAVDEALPPPAPSEDTSAREVAPVAEAPPVAPPAPPPAAEAAPVASGFVVQIGAFPSDAEAAAQWQSVKSSHGAVLSGLKPDIKRVDLKEKGIWFRLRVGPFDTRADAVAACEALKARGAGCMVTAR